MSSTKIVTAAAVIVAVGAVWGAGSLITGPDSAKQEVAQAKLRPSPTAPPTILKRDKSQKKSRINGTGSIRYQADGHSSINLADVPRVAARSTDVVDYVRGGSRVDSRFSDEQIAAAVAAAQAQAKADAIQNIDGSQKPVGFKPEGGVAEGDRQNMGNQPEVISQHWLKRLQTRIEQNRAIVSQDQRDGRDSSSGRKDERATVDDFEDQAQGGHAHPDVDHRLVHIRNRCPARDGRPHCEADADRDQSGGVG